MDEIKLALHVASLNGEVHEVNAGYQVEIDMGKLVFVIPHGEEASAGDYITDQLRSYYEPRIEALQNPPEK